MHFQALQLVMLGWSSDEMKCLTQNFQVDLENFEFNLKFHVERIQDKCQ